MIPEKLIKRDLFQELLRDLGRKEISLIIGPRQSGKTTLIRLLQRRLESEGHSCLFLSLDFEQDREHFSSQQRLIQKINLELGDQKGFVFIDEIQRKEEAGLFLKGIADRDLAYKFIVTGSGSIDLKARTKESLLGRKRVYELYPVSLLEFTNYRTAYRYEGKLADFFSADRDRADQYLLEYLNFGGYPRVVLESEQREKVLSINEIYQGYIEKDISYLLHVDKVDAFGVLAKVLADQIGGLVNYAELCNTIGISLPTLKNYLWYAEKTYILQRCTPYFRNARKEVSKAPTVYFSDLGLRNYLLGLFGTLTRTTDLGYAFQNLVFLVLTEKCRYRNAAVHYWRSKAGAEVDFVVDLGRNVVPVEVKHSDLFHPAVPRSVRSFIDQYSPELFIIVNKNLQATVSIKNCEVRFITVWDLVLEDIG